MNYKSYNPAVSKALTDVKLLITYYSLDQNFKPQEEINWQEKKSINDFSPLAPPEDIFIWAKNIACQRLDKEMMKGLFFEMKITDQSSKELLFECSDFFAPEKDRIYVHWQTAVKNPKDN